MRRGRRGAGAGGSAAGKDTVYTHVCVTRAFSRTAEKEEGAFGADPWRRRETSEGPLFSSSWMRMVQITLFQALQK